MNFGKNTAFVWVGIAAVVWYFFVRSNAQFSLAVVSAGAGTTTPKLASLGQGSANLATHTASHTYQGSGGVWGARSQGGNHLIQQRG